MPNQQTATDAMLVHEYELGYRRCPETRSEIEAALEIALALPAANGDAW